MNMYRLHFTLFVYRIERERESESIKDETVVRIKIRRGRVGMMAAKTIYHFMFPLMAQSMTIARRLCTGPIHPYHLCFAFTTVIIVLSTS